MITKISIIDYISLVKLLFRLEAAIKRQSHNQEPEWVKHKLKQVSAVIDKLKAPETDSIELLQERLYDILEGIETKSCGKND